MEINLEHFIQDTRTNIELCETIEEVVAALDLHLEFLSQSVTPSNDLKILIAKNISDFAYGHALRLKHDQQHHN